MSLTSIIGKAFLPRQKSLEHHFTDAEALQQRVLAYLINKGKNTEYGRKHLFATMKDYTDFATNIPVNTYEELKEWHARSGLPLRRFFNTSGLKYKSLALKDKLPTMTEDEQLHLLATDGMLVKRPLVVGDDFVLVGFKPDEWASTLK